MGEPSIGVAREATGERNWPRMPQVFRVSNETREARRGFISLRLSTQAATRGSRKRRVETRGGEESTRWVSWRRVCKVGSLGLRLEVEQGGGTIVIHVAGDGLRKRGFSRGETWLGDEKTSPPSIQWRCKYSARHDVVKLYDDRFIVE